MPWESNPASKYEAVTPHDSNGFSATCRALFVGTAGNVAVVDEGGTAVTFTGVQAGSILPVRAIRVNSTNTTASDIVALW